MRLVDCQTTRRLIICSNFPICHLNKGTEEPARDQTWMEVTVRLQVGTEQAASHKTDRCVQGRQRVCPTQQELLFP